MKKGGKKRVLVDLTGGAVFFYPVPVREGKQNERGLTCKPLRCTRCTLNFSRSWFEFPRKRELVKTGLLRFCISSLSTATPHSSLSSRCVHSRYSRLHLPPPPPCKKNPLSLTSSSSPSLSGKKKNSLSPSSLPKPSV